MIDGVTLNLTSGRSDCLNGKSVTIQKGAKVTARTAGMAAIEIKT